MPVYITDTDGANSTPSFPCEIEIFSVNDAPYFSDLGDIIINEDNNYYQNWATGISTGAYNENQELEFKVSFDNPDLIESYNLDSEGYFSINPNENANGFTNFSIYLEDEFDLQSDTVTYLLTINPVNDAPQFDFNPPAITIDEDSDERVIEWAFNINPGGGNGIYKETEDSLMFVIAQTYDQTLFDNTMLPELIINEENEGVLSFKSAPDMNGQTVLSITLEDDGDNKLDDDDDTNDGENISTVVNFPIQINQINDIPAEFELYIDLRDYQEDETTFYTFEDGNIYFRYPYQSVYIENQQRKKLRFEWEWIDSLDIDIYQSINKDILMEHVYYRLEAIEVENSDNIIILADSLIHNISNAEIDYEIDQQNNLARIDIDLTLINGLDLSGNTPYHWRVVSQNYQNDYQNSDPDYYAESADYSFYIDLILPTLNMIPLYDDIISEYFDLYMLSSERLIDFDGLNRPVKLWVDYGNNGSDDEILFPNEIDSINYIYYLPYQFTNSGDIRLNYQMRDHVQNINSGLEDISFGIINPLSNSTINFHNNLINLFFPKNSTQNSINCVISKLASIDMYSNSNIIGSAFHIYPDNINLSNDIILSFDLDILNSEYEQSNLAIYNLDDGIWSFCETYIEDNKLKTNINKFGTYAILYDENHNTQLALPTNYILSQNYPNPFNPETTIKYYIPEDNDIELNIYNIRGEKVRHLYNGYKKSGYYSIIWNGKSDTGVELSSGIYILNFKYGNNVINNKMVKIK